MKPKTKKIIASCALSLPLLASSVLCPILAVKKASADVSVAPYMLYTRPLAECGFTLYTQEVDDTGLTYPPTFQYYDDIGWLPSTIGQGNIGDFSNYYGTSIDLFTTDVEEFVEFSLSKTWRLYTYYDGVELLCDQLNFSNNAPMMLPVEDLDRWSLYAASEMGNVYYWSFSCEVYDTSTHEWYTSSRGASIGQTVNFGSLFSSSTPTVTYRNTEFILCRDFTIVYDLYDAWGITFRLETVDNFSVSTDVTLAQDYIYTDILSPTIVEEIVPTPSEVFFGMVDDFLSTEFMPNFTFGDLCLIALGISAFFMFLKIWMGG